MAEVRLRCTVCGHEEMRPWTAVTWGERCPRCTTGRLLRTWAWSHATSAHIAGQTTVHVMREEGSVCGLHLTGHEWCWCSGVGDDPPKRWAKLGLTACRTCRRLAVAEDGGPRTPADDYAETEVTGL